MNFIIKNKHTIIVALIVILIFSMTYSNMLKDKQIKEAKQELIEASKPSEIEFLKQMKAESKEDVDFKRNNVEMFERSLEGAKKEYEVAVWLDRCIEAKAILLLSGTGSQRVDCTKNLENFASYNLYDTRLDLGL